MAVSQTDPYDRRALLVSDKGDGSTFKPIHKERGTTAESDDPVIPIGVLDNAGKWEALSKSDLSGGGAVTIGDGDDAALGATTDAESSSGNGTVIALLKRLRTLLTTWFATNNGKTINSFVLAQGGAGTTQIAAASSSNKHKILGAVLTMDAAGTIQFTDGAGNLTGAMPVDANGGFVIPASIVAMIETSTTNTTLSIVTTGGAAKGVIRYLTEP